MAEEIKISIGADTTQLQANLVKAQNTLKQFQSALQKATNIGEIKYLQRNIQALETEIETLGSTMSATQGQMSRFSAGSAQATNTMTNLSRVVQDAPFGFMAISNNINPLIESFGRLKTETGSTQGAFSAMLGSLKGAGGLGFGISLITSGILALGSAFKKNTEETKAITVAYDQMSESIKRIEMAYNAAGAKSDFFTQMQMESNWGIKDLNNAYFDQEKGIEALRMAGLDNNLQVQENAKVVSKLTDELEAAKKATTDWYWARTQGSGRSSWETDLEAQNAAEKSQEYIDLKKAEQVALEKLWEWEKKGRDLGDKQLLLNKQLSNAQINLTNQKIKDQQAEKERLAQIEKAKPTIEKLLAKLKADLKDQVNIGDFLNISTLDTRIGLIDAAIQKLIADFNVPATDDRLIAIKVQLDELKKKKFENDVGDIVNKLNQDLTKISSVPGAMFDIPSLKEQTKLIESAIENLNNLQLSTGEIVDPQIFENLKNLVIKFNNDIKDLKPQIAPDIKIDPTEFDKQLQQVGAVIEGMVNDYIISFAETIGAAFSGKKVNFLDGFYDILSAGLIQIGKLLIKIAGLAELVQKALSNLFSGPQGAVMAAVAGFALIALGSAIKSLKSSKFAVGTRFAPGGMALVGERGPELVNIPRGSQVIPAAQTSQMMGGVGGSIEVFGVLRGQDIYFSNKKYGQTYNRQT